MPSKHHAIIFTLIFLALVAVFYPQYYLISDEHHYAKTAWLLADEGTTTVADPLYSSIFSQRPDGLYASKYPVGYPLLLAPLMILDFDFIFLLNILLHLAAFYCFYLILQSRKLPSIYSALYLFFPFFAYYSFTLFTDYTATALLMILFYFATTSTAKSRGWMSGTLMIVILYVRPLALLFVPFFYSTTFTQLFQSIKVKKLRFTLKAPDKHALLVFLPFLTLFAFFQLKTMLVGYVSADVDSLFIFDNPVPVFDFFRYLLYQTEILLLFYPFMLLVLLVNLKKKIYLWGIAAYILFLSFIDYTGNVTRITGLTSMVRHVRYMLPAMALLLPDYCAALHSRLGKLSKQPSRTLVAFLVLVLILSTSLVLFLHHGATTRNRHMVEDLYAHTTEDSLIVSNTLAYLLHDSFGDRKYLGIDDYGETFNGTFYPAATSGHNISASYISSHLEDNPGYIAITRGAFINDFPETHATLQRFIDTYDGELIYDKEYGCSSCHGLVGTIHVELYALTTTSPS